MKMNEEHFTERIKNLKALELDDQIKTLWDDLNNHCPFCHVRLDPLKKPVLDHYGFDKGTDRWAHKKCQEFFLREDNDEP